MVKDGTSEWKNWVPQSGKCTNKTGKVYFILKQEDHEEMVIFEKETIVENAVKQKLLALKLLDSYFYVGKDGCTYGFIRFHAHVTENQTPVDKILW